MCNVSTLYFMWSSQYLLEGIIIETGKLMLVKGKYLPKVTQWVGGGLKNRVLTDYKSLFFACHSSTYFLYNWNLVNVCSSEYGFSLFYMTLACSIACKWHLKYSSSMRLIISRHPWSTFYKQGTKFFWNKQVFILTSQLTAVLEIWISCHFSLICECYSLSI